MEEKYWGLIPFFETRSTCSWNFSSRRSARSINSIPIGWLKSTIISTSLFSEYSFLATEPKTPIELTWNFFSSSGFSSLMICFMVASYFITYKGKEIRQFSVFHIASISLPMKFTAGLKWIIAQLYSWPHFDLHFTSARNTLTKSLQNFSRSFIISVFLVCNILIVN